MSLNLCECGNKTWSHRFNTCDQCGFVGCPDCVTLDESGEISDHEYYFCKETTCREKYIATLAMPART